MSTILVVVYPQARLILCGSSIRAPHVQFPGSGFTRARSEGIEAHELDGVDVHVYGMAKTVADCFKYRNKLGLEVALEALKLYLREKRGRPDELIRFARVCRVEKVMRPYIEALL